MDSIYNFITDLLHQNQFLQGGFVLGILTWLGYQIKSFPELMWKKLKYYFTYQIYFDGSSDFYDEFVAWLNEKYPQKFKNVEVRIVDKDFQCASSNQTVESPVSYRDMQNAEPKWKLWKQQFTDTNIIWFQNRLLWISKNREKMEMAQGVSTLYINSYTISGFLAKKQVDNLCNEIFQQYKIKQDKKNPDLTVFSHQGDYFHRSHINNPKALKHIFFADKEKYLDDLQEFRTKKEFYKEKGIRYKRSYLFYGRGGTGKTSLAFATAKMLEQPLFLINLGAIFNDAQFTHLASQITPNSVVLMEDIDCVLNQREVKKDALSFSTLLNFLDGAYSPTNVVFIMTTNKPECLDDALVRKGRVDIQLHIDYPNKEQVERFLSDFYETTIVLDTYQNSKPMSEIQDICLQNNDYKQAMEEIIITKTFAKSA